MKTLQDVLTLKKEYNLFTFQETLLWATPKDIEHTIPKVHNLFHTQTEIITWHNCKSTVVHYTCRHCITWQNTAIKFHIQNTSSNVSNVYTVFLEP